MNYTRNEYPRPQFQRKEWQTLNGEWEFTFDDECVGELKGYSKGTVQLEKKINVPFAYQTEASGINDYSHHEIVWYRRKFKIEQPKKNVLLCFNASDYQTDVYVNGHHVIRHLGGFSPFSCDITKYLKEENVIVVKCVDPLDNFNVRGKQSYKGERFECWYIPTTGIWQSVWLEYFDKDYIDSYSLFTDIDKPCVYGSVKIEKGIANKLSITISYKNKIIKEHEIEIKDKNGKFEIPFDNIIDLWTIENPNLYNVKMELYKDEKILDSATTRVGFRKVSVENGQICLNHKPLYQKLILDQGYWKESSITPPSIEALKEDIIKSKEMGFNGARKHQKFEDPYFYYYAEELGFLVWCEMPSAYNFCETEIHNVTNEWLEILTVAKNFTSVISYVVLNESWGVGNILNDKKTQSFATGLYHLTKSIDDTRLISVNDGWENLSFSDFYSIHDYAYDDSEFRAKYIEGDFDKIAPAGRKFMAEGHKFDDKPILFDEFGGVALKAETKGEAWGYGQGASSDSELYNRMEVLVKGIYKVPKFQGFCYTQLTDCEQEINGLLDVDHKPKFDIEKIKKIIY